jgi:hypothetical protein
MDEHEKKVEASLLQPRDSKASLKPISLRKREPPCKCVNRKVSMIVGPTGVETPLCIVAEFVR